MRFFTSLFLLTFLCFTSCQNSESSSATAKEETATQQPAEQTQSAASNGQKYKLTPVNSGVQFPDAKIEYSYFSNGQFGFNVSNYQLGAQTPDAGDLMCANSGKGQHIHLIFDDAPYSAQYTNIFDFNKEDGRYYMLAFLGKSYHESIKTPDAYVAHRVSVRDNSIYARSTIKDPVLFYSRPKGTYVGKDAEKVMLDFYLLNADLEGQAYKVYADINGERHLISKWQSYYIEGLPYGENTITLTLVYNSGEKVETRLNPVTRTFTLKKDPAG
ncbi:MAG: phosphopeptide-binding protein [Bacteroidota bacterium]